MNEQEVSAWRPWSVFDELAGAARSAEELLRRKGVELRESGPTSWESFRVELARQAFLCLLNRESTVDFEKAASRAVRAAGALVEAIEGSREGVK